MLSTEGTNINCCSRVPAARRVPKQIAGVLITRVGYINEGSEILIEHENGYTTELEAGGWEHFSTARRRNRMMTARNAQPRQSDSGHRCCSHTLQLFFLSRLSIETRRPSHLLRRTVPGRQWRRPRSTILHSRTSNNSIGSGSKARNTRLTSRCTPLPTAIWRRNLLRLARRGVQIRLYRDREQYEEEQHNA